MFLKKFHQVENGYIQVSADQGSRFAKEIANDFNPLHNPESKRFCVPGDLLFSLVLSKQGLAQKMHFKYTGMVGKDAQLIFPQEGTQSFSITDQSNKTYMEVKSSGDINQDQSLIENFARAYVAFSGLSFPHILVPLMKKNQVMINPDRPMVIYESMAFQVDNVEQLSQPKLELTDSTLLVEGKRGLVTLHFDIYENDTKCGSGYKNMTLGGLREFDETKMQGLIEDYEASKHKFI